MLSTPRQEQSSPAAVTRPERMSPIALTLLCGVVALAVTLGVILLPFVRFAYEAPELHVALETLAAVVALLVAFLVHGRFRQSGRVQDLLLALSLAVVALANLLLASLPNALDLGGDPYFNAWAPLFLRLIGTVLLALAALSPMTLHARQRRAMVLAVGTVSVGVAVVLVSLWVAGPLPPALDPSIDLGDAGRPVVVGHPVLLVVQVVGALLYGMAAFLFTRQAGRTGDELLRWLGAGCVFAAFARVNYVLFPSLYTDFVYAGDILRLAFYLVLLVGAGREISTYWHAQSQAAVLEDRRRMARDLHDGLTQELSYIWNQTRQLAATNGDAVAVERIGGAAGRALDEARRAIAALTRPMDEDFSLVLQQSLDELASRYDVSITSDLDADAAVTSPQCEALLRIVGEGVRNGVRHGGAQTVHVSLRSAPLSLTVHDDGRGFVPATARSQDGGFGLISMRERAEGLGASFSISSTAGQGTEILVQWTP